MQPDQMLTKIEEAAADGRVGFLEDVATVSVKYACMYLQTLKELQLEDSTKYQELQAFLARVERG